MVKVHIEWIDQHHRWHRFQTKHHEADAYRTAKSRAERTNTRHRIVDDDGQLIDLVEP